MAKNEMIEDAIAALKSQRRLGRAAGISQQQISKMLHGRSGVTAESAIAIEKATNGEVPRWRLRPDLWAAPQEGAVA